MIPDWESSGMQMQDMMLQKTMHGNLTWILSKGSADQNKNRSFSFVYSYPLVVLFFTFLRIATIKRKFKIKGASFSGFTHHTNFSSMFFYYFFANVEAEPKSGKSVQIWSRHTIKAFKNLLLLIFADPFPKIPNRTNHSILAPFKRNNDLLTLSCIFDGVADKISNHLPDPFPICINRSRLVIFKYQLMF